MKYVIDLVANDILGNDDCAAPPASDFGIALTSHREGRYHIYIGRKVVPYKVGVVGERHQHLNIRLRKLKRDSS